MTTYSMFYYETMFEDEPTELHAIDYACSRDCLLHSLSAIGIADAVAVGRMNEAYGTTVPGGPMSWGATPCPDFGDSAEYCLNCGVMMHRDYEDEAECHSTPFVVNRFVGEPEERCDCGVLLKVAT